MYALFVHINGSWGLVGLDEHEECATGFVALTDLVFGDGASFVCKLPDHGPNAELAKTLSALERGDFDMDAALKGISDIPKRHDT